MKSKLTSRKFWIAVAAFLASMGAGITGLCTDNTALAMTGTICTIASAAIYAACEAYVDAAAAPASLTTNTTSITANTESPSTINHILNNNTDELIKIGDSI